MTVRPLAFLVLPVNLLVFACRGENPQAPPEMMGEAQEESASAERRNLPEPPVYEAVTVANGGAVTGSVRLVQEASPLADIPVLKNQAVCGEHRPNPSLVLGGENGVANVVVSLVGVRRGKPMDVPAEPALLDQVQCEYVPHLQAVPVGTTLEIVNSDPILHNVHAYLNATESIFNLALPIEGYRIQRTLDVPGIVSVRCDAGHTWMSAYIVVQEHPYYSITNEDGSYSIEEVPAGPYRLKLWHSLLGETEVPVEIEEDTTATVDLELNAPVIDPS